MIQPERIDSLNGKPFRDRWYVLYWMQSAQRADWNHALEHAVRLANERHKPILAAFCLAEYPDANLRHYHFILHGLRETAESLHKRGILLAAQIGDPGRIVPRLAKDADLVVTDEGYLRIQRRWRQSVSEGLDCAFHEVTTNLIVPVDQASDKEDFAARTFRPRISRQLDKYLAPLKRSRVKYPSLDLKVDSLDLTQPEAILKKLKVDTSVTPVRYHPPGSNAAQKRLRRFLREKIDDYDKLRNDPSREFQSGLSPYLHFGQISPLHVALEVHKTDSPGKAAFLEELIVRRELSHNFVSYNPRYDQYEGLPPWALRTLNFHAKDKRSRRYSLEQLELAQTGDSYWNAAQNEMALTGKMHGYMRMYWGKKILEWTPNPKEAFEIALYLNNKYELDGRDPNSYAGVAWCFGKHDRPWKEREIFGTVRYMNAAGLKRKFDPDAYVRKVESFSP